jgi:hypothetical protein
MTLDEHDFLTFQLYNASKTPRIKKARIRQWIMTSITFFGLAYLFHIGGNEFLRNYFLLFGALSVILYPFYSRWRYKNHYRKFIRDTYKNRFGQESYITFEDEAIVTKDVSGEAKVNVSEIEEVHEIKEYYFLQSRMGGTLIISKNKTDNIQDVTNAIKSMVEARGVKHSVELDWRWR